ncbi:hypothetical protein CTI12_AA517020 [Artemisia annua]|uniref:Uncharacterized protein n=1 Tax=Artemisia annua TaxID=35608 RepID=A0A2U1L948_ARTAN|nr:hypothetical protein CTI12_AA517020 [Artemisia annua]
MSKPADEFSSRHSDSDESNHEDAVSDRRNQSNNSRLCLWPISNSQFLRRRSMIFGQWRWNIIWNT